SRERRFTHASFLRDKAHDQRHLLPYRSCITCVHGRSCRLPRTRAQRTEPYLRVGITRRPNFSQCYTDLLWMYSVTTAPLATQSIQTPASTAPPIAPVLATLAAPIPTWRRQMAAPHKT